MFTFPKIKCSSKAIRMEIYSVQKMLYAAKTGEIHPIQSIISRARMNTKEKAYPTQRKKERKKTTANASFGIGA